MPPGVATRPAPRIDRDARLPGSGAPSGVAVLRSGIDAHGRFDRRIAERSVHAGSLFRCDPA